MSKYLGPPSIPMQQSGPLSERGESWPVASKEPKVPTDWVGFFLFFSSLAVAFAFTIYVLTYVPPQ